MWGVGFLLRQPLDYLNVVTWFVKIALLMRRTPIVPELPCELTLREWPGHCQNGGFAPDADLDRAEDGLRSRWVGQSAPPLFRCNRVSSERASKPSNLLRERLDGFDALSDDIRFIYHATRLALSLVHQCAGNRVESCQPLSRGVLGSLVSPEHQICYRKELWGSAFELSRLQRRLARGV